MPDSRELSFWFAVACVGIFASVAVKLIAARTPWQGFMEMAAAA